MKLKKSNKQVGAVEKTWHYNPQPIELDKVVYIRGEIFDNAPELNAVFESKRYRAKVNFYYNKPTTLHDIKNPTYSLWSHMSDYHAFRNNKYKPDGDPHKDWYEDIVDKAKEFNQQYSSDAVIMHGCLGCVKNHNQGNGGYGPHNQPRFTVDAMHSKHDADLMMMQLHLEDHHLELELNKVTSLKTKQGNCKNFSAEADVV